MEPDQDPDDLDGVDADAWVAMSLHGTVQHFPDEARRMGLDRWSAPGLVFAAALNARRPSHRLVAWLMLAGMVLAVLLTLANALR